MNFYRVNLIGLIFAGFFQQFTFAAPTVGETTVLGPFASPRAAVHPDNLNPHRIRFYGTDLGWTYEHDGKIHIIFGDTHADPDTGYIEESTGEKFDDGFGTIDLTEWRDPARFSDDNVPVIRLGQNPGTAEMSAINPGHAMEGFKTPVGAFSNGEHEFGIFYISKPEACMTDHDCGNGLTCDKGLGYTGWKPYDEDEHTFGCVDGSEDCYPDPLDDEAGSPSAGSGLCVNKTSSNWAETDIGRISGVGLRHLVGIRSTDDPRKYMHIKEWLTNKFANPAVRTVRDFDPGKGGDHARQDYRPLPGNGGSPRVFLWGRPGFVGVKATGRDLGLYFAWADMPSGPDFEWDVHYYTGTDENGVPQFSGDEKQAVALDLNAAQPGVQPVEDHDVVDQMSVAWVEHLKKWVMFYGGGMGTEEWRDQDTCGVLEFFTGPECTQVVIGNGAFRMRTADNPWGPWTEPQDVLVAGDPHTLPLEHQYVEGGSLYHPECRGEKCVEPTGDHDYGFFYASNIIAQWTRPAGEGVDIIWNASTWNPYHIILLRTRINP